MHEERHRFNWFGQVVNFIEWVHYTTPFECYCELRKHYFDVFVYDGGVDWGLKKFGLFFSFNGCVCDRKSVFFDFLEVV